MAEPLNKMLRKNNLYKQDESCQQAFEGLKEKLMSAPILTYPDFTKPFSICCNASNFGLGAILQQKDEEGRERVIQYASRTLNKHERNYSTTEKEELAIVWRINVYCFSFLEENLKW